MRFNQRLVSLVASLPVITLALTGPANAQSRVVGTSDRNNAVIEFQIPGSPFPSSSSTLVPTGVNSRPRGIDYDFKADDLYIATSRPSASAKIQVNSGKGVFKRQFSATVNDGSGNRVLGQLNDLEFRPSDGKLFVTNAYVYGGSDPNRKDPNIYVFNTKTANPVGTVFAVSNQPNTTNVFFNGLNFGSDKNLYVVRQNGNSGSGTGYLDRFNGTTGAFIDTVVSKAAMFGVAHDPAGDIYFGSGKNIFKMTKTGVDGSGNDTFGVAVKISSNLNTTMLCDVYFARDGYLYAAGLDKTSLFKIDPVLGTVLGTQGSGFNDVKNDFLSEVVVVPEPGNVAWILSMGLVSGGLILRRRILRK